MRRSVNVLLGALVVCIGVTAGVWLNHGSTHKAFIGDSLTESWFFPRANLGMHGETSDQILDRFQSQILGHHFKRVYVLAGTNDLLLHLPVEKAVANLKQMLMLARRDHIEPVLGEIPPIYAENGALEPSVKQLNKQIVEIGAEEHVAVVPYYEALGNDRNMQLADGIHLRRRGYLMMEYALVRTSNPF